jgi:trigger factor
MRAGEEQTVTVDFPTDYRNPQIAGRTVTFQVKVHKVEEPRLPEVDEAFIRSFGVEEGGLDALRSEVRANMERELRDTLQARLKQQVMDALLGAVPLEVPRVLVNAEAERLRLQATEGLGRGAASSGSFHLPLSLFEEQARRRVALGLILGELARTAQVRLDPVRVRSRVESLASTYQQPEEVVRWYYADKRRLSEVESVVLEDQLVDWLLGRATVVDASTSFGDVMKPGQTAGEETS